MLIQLRADASFRSNIGVANLQNTIAHVTFTLYDKNNNQVSEGTITLEPYAVIAPTSITANFFFGAPNADLSDARVMFHSDSPIGAYASVIDNATSDPTYFPAMSISGF